MPIEFEPREEWIPVVFYHGSIKSQWGQYVISNWQEIITAQVCVDEHGQIMDRRNIKLRSVDSSQEPLRNVGRNSISYLNLRYFPESGEFRVIQPLKGTEPKVV